MDFTPDYSMNFGTMARLTKIREKVVFSFTLKWFHVIIVLLKIIDSLGPFLIVRCKKWEDLWILITVHFRWHWIPGYMWIKPDCWNIRTVYWIQQKLISATADRADLENQHLDVSTHPKIIVYTPESVLEYETVDNRIISVSEKEYYQTSFQGEDFLAVLQGLSPEISGADGERILTLSTCNGNSAQRRIVRCRLIEESNVQ